MPNIYKTSVTDGGGIIRVIDNPITRIDVKPPTTQTQRIDTIDNKLLTVMDSIADVYILIATGGL